MDYELFSMFPGGIAGFFVIIAWSMIWKGVALWKSGRNNQKVWFIVLFLVNTMGLLEIIYLVFFRKLRK